MVPNRVDKVPYATNEEMMNTTKERFTTTGDISNGHVEVIRKQAEGRDSKSTFIKVSGARDIYFPSSIFTRKKSLFLSLECYDRAYTKSITLKDSCTGVAVSVAKGIKKSKTEAELERRTSYAKQTARIKKEKAKANNRKAIRNHLNDCASVLALSQGASAAAALGNLVSVIAKKTKSRCPPRRWTPWPSLDLPDVPKSPSIIEISDYEGEYAAKEKTDAGERRFSGRSGGGGDCEGGAYWESAEDISEVYIINAEYGRTPVRTAALLMIVSLSKKSSFHK